MAEHRGGSGNFAENPEKASEAVKKGGQNSGGNFAKDRKKASGSGKKGGQNSHIGGRKSEYPDQAAGPGKPVGAFTFKCFLNNVVFTMKVSALNKFLPKMHGSSAVIYVFTCVKYSGDYKNFFIRLLDCHNRLNEAGLKRERVKLISHSPREIIQILQPLLGNRLCKNNAVWTLSFTPCQT